MVVRGMSLKTEFRMGITCREVAFGQDCKAILPAPGIDAKYLAYAIQAKSEDILDLVDEAGHGTGRLQMDLLGNVQIPLPSLPEQQAIARVLSLVDDKLDSVNRTRQLITQLLDCLAAQLEAELPPAQLSEVAHVSRSVTNPQNFGEQLVDHYSIPAFDDRERPERTPGSKIMSNKLLIPGRAILVSRLNPRFDRTWWVTPDSGITALASPEFLCLTEETLVALAGVWLSVRAPSFRREVVSRVTGTSGSHQRVRPEDMLSVLVPDVREIDQVTSQRAVALLCAREQRACEADALTRLRDLLLPGLVNGIIPVDAASEAIS
jgi:type I restriction enzyme S subunit